MTRKRLLEYNKGSTKADEPRQSMTETMAQIQTAVGTVETKGDSSRPGRGEVFLTP